MLIQARTNMKSDSAQGYIRSIIEMGGLLKAIAVVEDKLEDEPAAEPAAEPAPVDQTKVQPANDPNAKI